MDNEFLLAIISTLNKKLSKRRLKSDLKALDDSMYVKVIAKLSTTLSKRQLKKDLKQLNDLYVKIGADLKVDKKLKSKLQGRIQELQDSIAEIEIKTKVKKTKLSTEADIALQEVQKRVNRTPVGVDLEIKKNKAISDIEYLGKRFSKLFSNVSAKQKYQDLLTSAFSISDDSQLRSVRAQISAFTSELRANGLASKSLGDKWKGLIDRGKDLFSAAGIVSAVFSQVRQSVSTFLGLDTAMTNLYKVQDQITSRDQFSGLLLKWNRLAQKLSVTTESLINSSADWSKIGFDLDMSEQLAQITAIFEKTAEISNAKANSTLISVAQAFPEIDGLGEDDYVERVQAIGDKINKVGNEFAIDSEGVSDALQNSSAALRMANNDLDESIAIVTTANKIFQSPDEVGNMSKVLAARLRGQRGELEALNEDTDGMIESVNKIQTQILNLTHNKVNIFEADNETLKSTYDIIREIGAVYDTLSDKDQADLLEIIAGKQRMSAVASLLLNYKELEKVKNASMNADNSMQQEYDKYLESAEAHIITFKEKLVETYSAFMGGDLIKYAADTGSAILDLVNSTDLLRHGILAVLALNFGKGISAISMGVAGAVKQMNTLGSALQQVKNLPLDGGLRTSALESLGNATKGLTEKNLKLLLSQKQLSVTDRISILQMHDLTREEALAKLEKMGLTTVTNAQTAANTAEAASTFTLSGAMNALKASALGMWTAFKAAFAANPIGMILTIATTAISIFSTVMSNHSQAMEEAKQKSIEMADKAAEESQRISELLTKYNNLTEEVKTNADAKDELLSTQDDLLESLGIEQSEIDKLVEKYGSLSEAVNRVAVDKLKEKRSDLLAGYNAKKDDVLEIGEGYDNWYSVNNRNMIDASGKDAVKAFKVLKKAGIVDKGSFGSGGGSLILTGDDSTIDGILENYQKLIDAENALSEAFSGEELSSNPLFTAINARKQQMQEAVESYYSSVDEINKNEANIQILESLRGKELPKTEEEFESFKNKMVETAKGSKEFIGSQEDIEDAVVNVLASMSEFSQFFDNISKEEQKAAENISGKANSSFKEAWQGLDKDPKNDILELAQAGALTVEKFNGMKGAAELLEKTGLTAEQLTKKINNLASSADQLSSMKTGISSISSALGEKKDNLGEKKTADKGVAIDTLGSMPEDVKECRKEYEKFCEVLGDGSSTMEECEEAADKLATAYVNNGNFLAKLTSKNEDYYISVLKEMGVQNAEQIVLDALNRKKAEATVQTMNFTNMTGEEIVKLLEEQGALNGTTEALKLYALKKIYANGNGLNTTDDINQLIALVKSLGYSTEAIDKYNEARNSAFKPTKNNQETGDIVNDILHGRKSVNSLIYDKNEYTEQQRENAAADIDSIIEKMENTKVAPPKVSVSPTGNPKDGDKGKSAKAKESRQEIDWLSRKLDTLQNKVDLLKTKFENLFSIGSKKNNLNQQIKQTEKLLKAQEKAASRYQKVADTYYKKNKKKLSKNGITLSMLQNGSYDVKSYKSGIAQIIQTYEDYYDKAQESKKATWELAAAIKDLSKQKLDLKLEDNERKRTYQEARYANATSANAKRKILNKEINTYKSDDKAYAQYHKESKKQLKKDGNTAKAAVNKTKGLGKAAKDKIKKLIKQGKEIPSALMKKVKKHSTSAYNKLLEYNRGVDFVSEVLRDKKLAKEQNETNMREKRIERAQNYADEAEAKYNLNQQYEANAVSAKDKNKYEAESLKYLNKQYDKLIKIAELEGDVTEQKRLQAEKQEKANESYQKMYDNIKAEYDNKTGLNDARISTIQSEIATLEAAGESVSKSLYDGMMKLNEDTKEKLLKERAELEEAGKNFKYGSEEWYAWQNDLEVINQGLYGCTQNTIEWKKALNELDFKKFKLMAGQLDATKSHLDFLVDMLSHKDLTSKESGGLTDAGFATISLRFAGIENYNKTIKNAQENLKELYEKHADGSDFLSEEEFLAKREEQLDIIRESKEAIADEKDAILDLVNNALELQIDSINELIEKKKKALATEKDLYEYQRKISKQTKNIALIQKQIAALSGDHSEEARAKVQKLQASLEEAQEDLKDTEYDRWHSDQEDMLDNLADEVEDFWERIMDDLKNNIDSSLDNILKMVTDNPDAVARALDELGLGDALSIITKYNPDGTHTNTAIDYGGNSYESTYDKDGDNVNNKFEEKYKEQTDGIHSDIKDLTDAVDKLKDDVADKLKDDAEKGTPWAEDTAQKAKEHAAATLLAQMQQKKEEAILAADKRAEGILQQSAGGQKEFIVEDVPMEGVQGAVEKFLNSSALHKPTTEAGKKRMKADPLLKYIAENYNGKTLSNVNEARLGAYLGVPVKDINNVSKSEANKILKAFQGAGFANGGIASTLNKAAQENGDDGLITIQRGEAVLTKAQTEAVQDMADRFIHVGLPYTDEQLNMLRAHFNTPVDYSGMMPKYQNAPVNNANTSVNVGDVNIHMDGTGVVDKESFRKTLRDYDVRSDIEQIALGDLTKGSIRNSMRYI